MRRLETPPDLINDAAIDWYVKDERVAVRFASDDGIIMSRVGPNAYRQHDALITGSNGDTWAVTPDQFELRYKHEAPTVFGQDGWYRNHPVPIKAQQMTEAFALQRRQDADWLTGQAGDWLVQYSVTDYGIVDQQRFALVYRRVAD